MSEFTMTKNEQGDLDIKLQEAEATAQLEQARAGVLEGITKFEVFGIPLGAAAGGLLAVGLMDMLRGAVAGRLPANIPQWAFPAIGAWIVTTKMVKGFIGDRTANAAGLLLTADAIQAAFNLRGVFGGLFKGAQLKQTMTGGAVGGNGHKEVTSIAEYNAIQGIS